MATKTALEQLIRNTHRPKPDLTRGQGMRLSTEQSSPPPPVERKPKRVKRGYALREDLIHQCKRIAVRERRPLYVIMDEALELLINARAQASTPTDTDG